MRASCAETKALDEASIGAIIALRLHFADGRHGIALHEHTGFKQRRGEFFRLIRADLVQGGISLFQ
jgi:hypothetical protein